MKKIFFIFCFLLIGLPVQSATRLGLHVTQEELDIWRTRKTSGPYKTTGDVSDNSPGDWDRIVTRKTDFMKNPAASRWTGQVSAQCWRISPPSISTSQGLSLMQAAFYYLVDNTAGDSESVRTAVRDELLNQAAQIGTNFADTVRWCNLQEDAYIHDYASWGLRLLHAYDYIRSTISASNRATLDQWFLDMGEYMDLLCLNTALTRWPNRESDDYSVIAGGWAFDDELGGAERPIYFGGPIYGNWHEAWTNRNALMITLSGLVGIVTNNTTLKVRAKRWFREYVTYAVFYNAGADTAHGQDYHRWWTSGPGETASLGWAYNIDLNTSMSMLADAFARIGDLSLYDYSTSFGLKGTSGGPKTFQKIVTTDLKYVVPDITHYATELSGEQDAAHRIDTQDGMTGENRFRDIYAAITNVYFQNATNKTIYMRTKSGAPAYPSTNVPFDERGEGSRALHPGILFMWGQMEGLVDPYNITLPPPTELVITRNIASGRIAATNRTARP